MNYLAHIYLSGENTELMLGNFMADSIKGKDWKKLPIEIQKGIILHRAIDEFTDAHPIVKASKSRLWKDFGHFHGVITDIYYDHFLAKNWMEYHTEPLDKFVEHTYLILDQNRKHLPEKTQHFYRFMKQYNWLYNYQYLSGIHTVFKGMAKRTRFNSGMENATHALEKDYDSFAYEFESFFPLLRDFVAQKIEDL